MYSSAQCSVIERVLLPTKDFTNGPETNVRRKKKRCQGWTKVKLTVKGSNCFRSPLETTLTFHPVGPGSIPHCMVVIAELNQQVVELSVGEAGLA